MDANTQTAANVVEISLTFPDADYSALVVTTDLDLSRFTALATVNVVMGAGAFTSYGFVLNAINALTTVLTVKLDLVTPTGATN